jgi:hypothetical protein
VADGEEGEDSHKMKMGWVAPICLLRGHGGRCREGEVQRLCRQRRNNSWAWLKPGRHTVAAVAEIGKADVLFQLNLASIYVLS